MIKAKSLMKLVLLAVLIITNAICFCGCWNYKDIEKALIISGVAIDKNKAGDKYLLTFEVLDFEMSGKEAKQGTKFVESEGKTIFEAVRNTINIVGKKLYWPHASIAIISEEIAKDGIIPVLDFIFRDSEVRTEMHILISKEKTAKAVLMQDMLLSQASSDNIDNLLKYQDASGKFPSILVYELINSLKSGNTILPAIELKEILGKKTVVLTSTGLFKEDKLIGYINEDESRALLFVKNNIKGGLITFGIDNTNKTDEISLEIFEVKTKVKPCYVDNKLTMDIDIKVDAAIAETQTSIDYASGKNFDKLKKSAEKEVKTSVENLIQKVQLEYNADIFCFGPKIKGDMPKVWKSIEGDWNKSIFKNLKTNVKVYIKIRNSAFMMKAIRVTN